MIGGKKATATGIVYGALSGLEEATKQPALQAFETAMKNVSPLVEVRSKRIGGATYQVPMEVRPDRKEALTMRWIIDAARKRQGKPMNILLKEELLDAYNSTGAAMKKREDLHKMAEANKAFAHFARF
jgi:small subunit ribosomal protein S7